MSGVRRGRRVAALLAAGAAATGCSAPEQPTRPTGPRTVATSTVALPDLPADAETGARGPWTGPVVGTTFAGVDRRRPVRLDVLCDHVTHLRITTAIGGGPHTDVDHPTCATTEHVTLAPGEPLQVSLHGTPQAGAVFAIAFTPE